MVTLTTYAYFVRKCVLGYINALELYQVFMQEFKETPRTKVAKKYVIDDPIIEDEDES
jgi:hypothetical protein